MWSSLIGLILITITGDLVTIMGKTWTVTELYVIDNKLLVEVVNEEDRFFKCTVPISYVTKQFVALSSAPIAPINEEHSLVYWAYSNLKHVLMHSFSDKSRVKDIRRDIAPCTPATLHAFGIEKRSVTYSVKDVGPFSTATWDIVLGHEWDKVANGTAVVMTLKFKQDKSCTLNFNKMIFVQVTLASNTNFKTMEGYRLHVKEHC